MTIISPKKVDIISLAIRNRIAKATCDEFRITEQELRGTSGTRYLTNARIAYAYLLKIKLNYTHRLIGDELNRDHSSISYLLQKEQDYRFTKDDVITSINRIEQQLFKQP